MKNNDKLHELIRRQEALLRRMFRSPKIIKGSLVELKRVCGKPNCRCQKGQKHASWYLSQSRAGKTKMIYIPKKFEKQAKEAVKRHKQLLRIVEELSELNIKTIKYREN